MKKKIVLFCAVLLIAVVSVTVFVACNKKTPEEKSNISRSVTALYVGESELFAVSIETGKREKLFIADGKANDVVSFAEITVTPLTRNDFTELEFSLSAEGSSCAGTLKGDNFGEFKSELNLNFSPAAITVTCGETTSTVDLQNVLENALSSQDIVNIAQREFADRITAETEGGDLNREIYIKVITGDRENYYYYIAYIGEGVDYWAMLLNPESGEVISKK